MSDRFDVVIVGASHAGATAAASLRQLGFTGSIALLTEERHLPYERPPLSKQYLTGERGPQHILLRPAEFWQDRRIDLRLDHRVVAVDAKARSLRLERGEQIAYQKLVWAAGGRARGLSCEGAQLEGVFTLREMGDADRLRAATHSAREVVIIGGGYIGLECAAAFAKLGKHVTLLEALDRVLARVAGEPVSRFYESAHREYGVDIRLGQTVVGLDAHQGRVTAVRVGECATVPADIVIVGIGITPAVGPLIVAGARIENEGVWVNEFCETSLTEVFAIGDCAVHTNRYADGMPVRIESVQNAHDQAQVVARAITGEWTPYEAIPWFWSNQYDLRLQTVGLSLRHDACVIRGSPANRSFSAIYLRQGKVVALDCINSPRDYLQGRLLVAQGVSVAPDALANPDFSLKDLCRPALRHQTLATL